MTVSNRPIEDRPASATPRPPAREPRSPNAPHARLAIALREAPATVPALGAVALLAVWSGDQAGYPLTHWAPGALIVLALLGIALAAAPPRMAEIPRPVKLALLCLAAYTMLSFLSILWAAAPGEAWVGADRTLLYLLLFALFACWPQRGTSAALLLCTWTVAMIGLAAFAVLHVDAAADSTARLAALLPGGRLVYPAGYANAAAAQWLMAFWPALLLARSPRLHWSLRGLLAGGAVLLAALALLSQSRGALYATPVMLALVFALLPGRVRTFTLLVPVSLGIAAATPAVLRVGDRLTGPSGGGAHARAVASAVHSATAAMLTAALVVGLVVALGAAVQRRRGPLTLSAAARVHRVIGAVAVAVLVALLAGGVVAAGDPAARVRHAWDTFKSGSGYAANGRGSRLTSGLGSNRYDFYRVALDQFAAHPVGGIGSDNFYEQYLRHGRSNETPHYPHSVELRTLTETGLIGALLAIAGLGAALLAVRQAIRHRAADPLAPAVAAAAVAGFAYWVVHGSVDWLWEFAGLGAPAFALLGLACALAPRAAASPGTAAARAWWVRAAWVAVAAIAVLCTTVSLAAPWLSRLQVQSAARIWVGAPVRAYDRLDDAARLNPLDDEPYVVAGSIALRRNELRYADHEFALALRRTPGDAYATLERGAIASTLGERRRARVLLERAAQLNPRDPLTRAALRVARAGRKVDVGELNRSILRTALRLS
jgi:tetratricopeptide (TPR) repeat protein